MHCLALLLWGMAIQRPYTCTTTVNAANLSSWDTISHNGKTYYVSPIEEPGSGNEVAHCRITATFASGGVKARSCAHGLISLEWLGTEYNDTYKNFEIYDSSEYTLSTGVEQLCDNHVGSTQSKGVVIIELTGDLLPAGIAVSYNWAKFLNSRQGHEVASGALVPTLAGRAVNYRIMYPKDYDSTDTDKSYPLVVSIAGDASCWGTNNSSHVTHGSAGVWLFSRYYNEPSTECISVCYQLIPGSSLGNLTGDHYYPVETYGFGYPLKPIENLGGCSQGGWNIDAIKTIIDTLIASDDVRVDTQKVVLAGFSRGSTILPLIALAARDTVATLILNDGWAVHFWNTVWSRHKELSSLHDTDRDWLAKKYVWDGVDVYSHVDITDIIARMQKMAEQLRHMNWLQYTSSTMLDYVFYRESSSVYTCLGLGAIQWPWGDVEGVPDLEVKGTFEDSARKVEFQIMQDAINIYNALPAVIASGDVARECELDYCSVNHNSMIGRVFANIETWQTVFALERATAIPDDPYPSYAYNDVWPNQGNYVKAPLDPEELPYNINSYLFPRPFVGDTEPRTLIGS